jgi:cell division protein YceG involved in septum cleavage
MSNDSKNEEEKAKDGGKREGILDKIIPAVVISLLVGGTSPWWVQLIKPPQSSTPSSTSNKPLLEGKVIYIHISAESQRNDAENLLRRLSDNAGKVYKVSNLVKDGTVKPNNEGLVFPIDNIQIKYFYTEDREASQLIKSLVQRNKVILDPQTEALKKDPQGTIEVWYPWVVDK